MEKVRRLEPLPETKRQLFLLSGNKCAFPGCEQIMLDQFGHFIGQICHIESANVGGQRFNASQSNEQRRHISNLVLMCPTHHGVTNNVQQFPVSKLKKIKEVHESKAFMGNGLIASDAETFVDSTFSNNVNLISNVNELPLYNYGFTSAEIIGAVNNFITILSRVPRLTRSFYAHCIMSSHGDDNLEFDPREIAIRLRISEQIVIANSAILQRFGLLSEVDSDNYPHTLRQYVISPTKDDNHIWFLLMVRNKYLSNPMQILDIFENLNFVHLES
ncbi:hypothetical protein ACE1BG_07520 [Aeromonas veronii]|uniref:hypothetical protein n=1 Tax=Aeromonas veronii TaxID=654 RepID=UPI0035BA4F12